MIDLRSLWLARWSRSFEPETSLKLPPPRTLSAPRRGYLAAATMIRNEGPYLREWLEFHRLVGFEHMYLYDDGSTDDGLAVATPYVESGFVTIVPWGVFALRRQMLVYAHALRVFGPEWRWMAFFDVDEFLFPVAHQSLPKALEAYEEFPGVVVPWHMYGFCGHETRPSGLSIENYTRRPRFPVSTSARRLIQWKSIVDPARATEVLSTHFVAGEAGKGALVTEERQPIDGARLDPASSTFRLNHYYTRSKEEFARRRIAARSHRIDRHTFMAELIESEPQVEDDLILRYVPLLRGLPGVYEP